MKEVKCLIICSNIASFDNDEINKQIECYKEVIKNGKVKFLISEKDVITKTILKAINCVYETTDEDIMFDNVAKDYIKSIGLGEGDLLVFVGYDNEKSFNYSVTCWEKGIKIIKICLKENYGIFCFQ